VTPSVLQTDANPAGAPRAVFEGLQAGMAANRSEFFRAVASGPFYNFDQPGVEPSEPVIANWWREGALGLCLRVHSSGLVRRPEEDQRAGPGHER
jgi:non-heme chloroperoxidase